MKKIVTPILAMSFLVGCGGSKNMAPVSDHSPHHVHAASDENVILPIFAPDTAKPDDLEQKYTVQWGNEGRAGAAKKIPGYVHVLGDEHRYQVETKDPDVKHRHEVWENPKTVVVAMQESSEEPIDPEEAITKPIPEPKKPKKAEPLVVTPDDDVFDVEAIYEKFCNGLELTPKEQEIFELSGGIAAIPKHMAETCNYQK